MAEAFDCKTLVSVIGLYQLSRLLKMPEDFDVFRAQFLLDAADNLFYPFFKILLGEVLR